MANIEVTNLHQLARTICHRIGWNGKIVDDSEMSEIWDDVLENSPANEFDRAFITSEFSDIVDPMGLETEEDYLTAVRSGKSRISRKQRKALWQLFLQFKRALNKRNLLTFDGIIHQARLAVEQGKFTGFRYVLVDGKRQLFHVAKDNPNYSLFEHSPEAFTAQGNRLSSASTVSAYGSSLRTCLR